MSTPNIKLTSDNLDTLEGKAEIARLLATGPEGRESIIQILAELNPDANKEFRKKQNKLKTYPYYREGFALELIKVVLDPMIADGESREFNKQDYKSWSINTVYEKVRQSFEYAIDFLDKEGKYKLLKRKIEIRKPNSNKVVIEFTSTNEPIVVRKFKATSSFDEVLSRVNDIVENGDFDHQFILPPKDEDMPPLSLSEEEIEKLEKHLDKFEAFIAYIVTYEKITINKFNPVREIKSPISGTEFIAENESFGAKQ